MASPNNRDLLTSFSPNCDFFAISSGDGRIKIWDTLKGALQTEFAAISASDESGLLSENKRGHLSLDYTCMKWVQLPSKKKRKVGASLLVLGTGSGDVLALDVSAGHLKWKASDSHSGGVTAIAYSASGSFVYTAGADGIVCKTEASTGRILKRISVSSKAISSLCVSSDGKMLATAAGQLRTFSCYDNKKIQKFSGHPVGVRCMAFTEDGSYILTSGVGERHIAIWKTGLADQNQGASCVLSMNHPAIFIDSKTETVIGSDQKRFFILAVSEPGHCYFWYGADINDLRDKKPTKISAERVSKGDLGIFGARIQGVVKEASGQMVAAYGSLVKPCFERASICYGVDVRLEPAQVEALLPMLDRSVSQKSRDVKTQAVTALNRANAEDANLPLPKLYAPGKKRKHDGLTDAAADLKPILGVESSTTTTLPVKKGAQKLTVQEEPVCLEDRMRELGLLGMKINLSSTIGNIGVQVDKNFSTKMIRQHVNAMNPDEVSPLFGNLVSAWRTRSAKSSSKVLEWIYSLLVYHSHHILSNKSSLKMLDDMQETIAVKYGHTQELLKLRGRLQLIRTQIDMVGEQKTKSLGDEVMYVEEESDDQEDEEIDEMIYREEEDESDMD
ncbi:WD repeat-containing protein 43 [Rhynchospora pubera]|uniref:WD repeat-containing protein 43 n=1 Tax=Rhynchospora pubera TaxID=906938 RepID=A0AAV8DBM2_9POAL|nr:WD repeat-containing protein 43 [Rhynchospora pubera]KAJ4817200.1 WD repeat-containing protein 43 [Rhynchospora pubera]